MSLMQKNGQKKGALTTRCDTRNNIVPHAKKRHGEAGIGRGFVRGFVRGINVKCAWAVTVWKFQEPGGRLTATGSRAFTLPVKTCF